MPVGFAGIKNYLYLAVRFQPGLSRWLEVASFLGKHASRPRKHPSPYLLLKDPGRIPFPFFSEPHSWAGIFSMQYRNKGGTQPNSLA